MAEITLIQYLEQIDHAVEGMRELDNPERHIEINSIQKIVRDSIAGLTANSNFEMVATAKARLKDIAPRVEMLVLTGIENRDTWPVPEPEPEK